MRTNGSGQAERSKPNSPSKCADVLEGILEGLGLGRVVRHLTLLRTWDRVIASRIRERATIENFRDGRLYVCVADPIWLHELHMLRHKLKTMLNDEIGEPVVADIVLRIGRTPRGGVPRSPRRRTGPALPTPPEAEARVQHLLAPHTEKPWCEALRRLLCRCSLRSF